MAQQEQRRFHRVAYFSPATLRLPKLELSGVIHDLSLKGALLEVTHSESVVMDDQGVLLFSLGDSLLEVQMRVKVVHVESSRIGLLCLNIDMDSISHLRRLVELNLGDEDMLERDLQSLLQAD